MIVPFNMCKAYRYKVPNLQLVLVINEYLEVLHDEHQEIPLHKEIDFRVDVLTGTTSMYSFLLNRSNEVERIE